MVVFSVIDLLNLETYIVFKDILDKNDSGILEASNLLKYICFFFYLNTRLSVITKILCLRKSMIT